MRRRSKAPYRPTTPEWRAAVRQALDDLGKDQVWLAQRLRTKPASVNVVLTGRVKSSGFVDEISKLLHIGLPDSLDRQIQENAEMLTEIKARDPSEYARLCERIERTLLMVKPSSDRND